MNTCVCVCPSFAKDFVVFLKRLMCHRSVSMPKRSAHSSYNVIIEYYYVSRPLFIPTAPYWYRTKKNNDIYEISILQTAKYPTAYYIGFFREARFQVTPVGIRLDVSSLSGRSPVFTLGVSWRQLTWSVQRQLSQRDRRNFKNCHRKHENEKLNTKIAFFCIRDVIKNPDRKSLDPSRRAEMKKKNSSVA